MTYDGIAGVRRMRIQLYPDDIEDRDVTPKKGGILGGFNPNKRGRESAAHERGTLMQMAQALARQGRGSDTEVAHVAPGEIVVPRALQNAEVMAVLRRAGAR